MPNFGGVRYGAQYLPNKKFFKPILRITGIPSLNIDTVINISNDIVNKDEKIVSLLKMVSFIYSPYFNGIKPLSLTSFCPDSESVKSMSFFNSPFGSPFT